MLIIIKRDGAKQDYQRAKIKKAIQESYADIGKAPNLHVIQGCVDEIERKVTGKNEVSVETIQDFVEKSLMEKGEYDVAKNYILYREKRTKLRAARTAIAKAGKDPDLEAVLAQIQETFFGYDLSKLASKCQSIEEKETDPQKFSFFLARAAAELTSQEEPKWEMIAGRLLSFAFHKGLRQEESNRKIGSFYEKIVYLTEKNLYGSYILEHYSREEIDDLSAFIDNRRDNLFTYSGLDLLLSRYVIQDHDHTLLESPQEMYLGIALHLAMLEKNHRDLWVKKFYDMLSLHQVTMATPTLSNARKPLPQLSSCFVDVVPDSLDGIYRSLTNFAEVSKYGGGMGLYFGKIRSRGSSIRGFEGASGGVIRWIRLVNDTAVAVNQLGMRQGAVAVYLDVWHKDIPEFLELRTNNGDERMKAHDVFPGICYPDLFWKMVKEDINQSWYLLDPHEVQMVKGYCLEDCFGEEWEKKYRSCVQDPRLSKRIIVLKDLIRLILRSAVETGTPFAFFRDTVNQMNPNKHKGMIYCSNLCTEIAQNNSPIDFVNQEIVDRDGDKIIVTQTKANTFVVCNLASLCLGNIDVNNHEALRELIHTAIRALDNVIDLNFYPLPYARVTNRRYRSIGLGVSGYHHMLANNGISWESEAHLKFIDSLFEEINYDAIEASCDLASERGSYHDFKGSEWETGEYFTRRHYLSPRWQALRERVYQKGLRNAYLIAVAPTSSTSILVGTTAGLDPIMKRYYLEEKKGFMLPRVAPNLSPKTYWYYKDAALIDQIWSIKAAGVRQRHIDQSQSVNLWITNHYKMSQLLYLYLLAWEEGVKTIYYVRSQSLVAEDCESCSA